MSEEVTDTGQGPTFEQLAKKAAGLDFDARQEFFAGLTEDERQRLFEAASLDDREQWATEEREHLEALVAGQQVEGAEFAAEPGEEIRVDGAEAPADRAPDVGAELIAQLVKERIEWEQRALRAERSAEERAATLDAYYREFGELPS